MFLPNKGRCYVFNVEYSIVVDLQRIKKIEKEKSSTNQYFARKIFCVGKIDIASGRETRKNCSNYLLRKNVAIIAKTCFSFIY